MNEEALLILLKERFDQNMDRHPKIHWTQIEERLRNNQKLLLSVSQMEETGGEPDVIVVPHALNSLYFIDCSKESPAGRRSLCYDQEARNQRKKNKPESSAQEVANRLGIELLTEKDYLFIQSIGDFDGKTSSWLQTPLEMRGVGGALFGDKRFNRAFVYHNGADSYYSARGFRGKILINE